MFILWWIIVGLIAGWLKLKVKLKGQTEQSPAPN
jgi:uncharacterized membrane protein YeaQ/YmgE (transglycosylase-associated protein family)